MVSLPTLKKRVKEMLEAADLSTITERKIREKLIEEFGEEDIKKHSRAVKNTVEKFLEEAGGEEEMEEYEGSEEGEGEERGTKRKGDDVQQDGKRSRVEGDDYVLSLGRMKRLTVRTFKGKLLVDLREYWMDKSSGEEKPSARGIALQREQWAALKAALPQLAAAQEARNTDLLPVELGSMRKAYVSDFKGNIGVHVREFFNAADGEQKPTKKGLNLDAGAMATLREHEHEVESHVVRLGGAAPPTPAPAPAAAGPSTASGGAASDAAGPSSAAPAAGAQAKEAEGTKEGMVELGGDKRCTVSEFKGAKHVDLREWYRKDGELRPGKKGISLQTSDWHTICSAAAEIDQALEKHDMKYALYLSGKRKVSLSDFKGKTYVAVREFYIKDNQELPGQKGLNMSAEQWRTLRAGMDKITAVVPS